MWSPIGEERVQTREGGLVRGYVAGPGSDCERRWIILYTGGRASPRLAVPVHARVRGLVSWHSTDRAAA